MAALYIIEIYNYNICVTYLCITDCTLIQNIRRFSPKPISNADLNAVQNLIN